MDLHTRNETVAELRSFNKKLTIANLALVIILLLVAFKLVFQTEIILERTPGMPNDAIIEKSSMDKGAQRATLIAVTSTIAQINPANSEYQKMFLQSFLSPTAYTKVSEDIDNQVKKLASQRELGSYYFILRGYQYDVALDKHFIFGEVHTVNAAVDTGENYVFEYTTHIENYRLLVDNIVSYPGTVMHNTEWLKANKK